MPDVHEFRTLEEMIVASSEMVRPPEKLTVSEAAAKYRYLNNPGSYIGPWRNEKTPYLTEFMDELTSMEYTGAVFVGPARTGKSDAFYNWLTHTAICDPSDMMFVAMTKEVGRDISLGDLAKVFRHTSALGSRLMPGRKNDNVHDKLFKSGMRLLIRWPTITELSGKTLPKVWFADYDRMEDDIAKEGPPFDLGKKRTQTFKRYGMTVAESSPGREIEDPKWVARTPHEAPPTKGILGLYNRGDRRRYYWRCIYCKEPFEPDFKLLNYPQSNDHMEAAEAVTLTCPSCSLDIDPSHKEEMNVGGRWVKDGMVWLPDGSMGGNQPRTEIASFWLKGVAAAFQDWKSLVYNYLQAQETFETTQDESALKKTVTADQGVPYTPKAAETSRLPEELKSRAEDWGGSKDHPVVPMGVRFLVASVDVQAGAMPHFVVQVHGMGVGGDTWLIDMFKIRKSERLDESGERHLLDPAAYLEDWDVLIDQVIERTYPLGDGSGRHMSIKAVACDSGGAAGVTANAYKFWRYLRNEHGAGHHARFRLVKGEGSRSAPRVRETYPDASRKDRYSGARGDVPVFIINTDLVKDQVAAMLGRTDPGLGMINFPIWAEGWLYTQLTSEVRTAKGWDNLRRRRNEAFDLLVYYLAICISNQYSIRSEKIDWDAPPRWAAEWDNNDLVLSADEEVPFRKPRVVEYDLAELGASLA